MSLEEIAANAYLVTVILLPVGLVTFFGIILWKAFKS